MAVKNRAHFKDIFKSGYKIKEEDYADWLDSYRHKQDPIQLSDAEGLEAFLEPFRRNDEVIPVSDIDGIGDLISSYLQGCLTSSSTIQQSQVEGLEDVLSNILNDDDVGDVVDKKLLDVMAPEISSEGTWVINGVDTGEKAVGSDGDSPYVGDNGNWWVGSDDLGVKATVIEPTTDFNHNIQGVRDGRNITFKGVHDFRAGTMVVYRGGMRLSRGGSYDYVEDLNESGVGVSVTFTIAPAPDENLIFEYKKV